MRLKLWQQVLFILLTPVLIAAAVIFFEFRNLMTIDKKITLIEIADDINITLLELRRYEKNIMLFKEDENLKIFKENLEALEMKVGRMENEIVSGLSKINYKSLTENIRLYEESSNALVSRVKKGQKLIEDIRPLGRIIENKASDRKTALEIRRHEKNYLIYKEQEAINKLRRAAKELIKAQPEIVVPMEVYLKSFDSLIENDLSKDNLSNKMRHYAREIEKITMELSRKKRSDIDKIIAQAKISFFASFAFLIIATTIVGCLMSINLVKTMKIIEKSFKRLAKGDFVHHIDIEAPDEIGSFVTTYNNTIKKLGESRDELEHTLKKIEAANKELVERQEELVEARKLTAMRLMASEIAHEINNPLSSLATFLGMFYEDMQADVMKKEALTLMLREVNRCQVVLKELADFAREEKVKLKEVNPAKLLSEAIDIINQQNRDRRINLKASLNDLPAKVLLDPVLIYQALVNVLSNAFQFTPPSGTIDVKGYTEGDIMTIVISDTGAGIPEENLSDVFEPFFSTRKESGGSGLGLAITRKIIERHNGSIHIKSKLGEGTVLTIKLPIGEV